MRTPPSTKRGGSRRGVSRNLRRDFPLALGRLVPGLISASFVESVDAFQTRGGIE